MQQLRRDPLHGQWVIVAPARAQRPNALVPAMPPFEEKGRCSFCPGNERDTPPEIDAVRPTASAANGPGWAVRVVPNGFPALSVDAASQEHVLHDVAELHRSQAGVGAHELVITTTQHNATPADLSVDQWDSVLATCQYRMQSLLADPRLKHVLLFENRGLLGGATRQHPHLQIVATPMTPQLVAKEVLNCRAYARRTEQCLLCDLVARELQDTARIVLADESFVAMVPYAARLPYEVWILPRVHRHTYMQVPQLERRRLAAHLRGILRRLELVLPGLSYNWVLHTVPRTAADPEVFHWHIEVLPRVVIHAGFEWGSGNTINPVSPEAAAERLRAASDE